MAERDPWLFDSALEQEEAGRGAGAAEDIEAGVIEDIGAVAEDGCEAESFLDFLVVLASLVDLGTALTRCIFLEGVF